MAAPDLVIIGGVVADRTPSGLVPGGAAFYAARAALALGARVGVLTHERADLDVPAALAGAEVAFGGAWDVTFTNTYGPDGRVQHVAGAPALLDLRNLPAAWQSTCAVLLAPVFHETPADFVDAFPHALIGVAPQGWMRRADAGGRVRPAPWEPPHELLQRAAAVSLSEEDLGSDVAAERELAGRCRLLVVTRGAAGCTLYQCGEPLNVPGFPSAEADPTGAGDVFAAAFMLRLLTTGNPRDAAAFANAAASFAVQAPGVTGLPSRAQVLARLAHAPDGEQP